MVTGLSAVVFVADMVDPSDPMGRTYREVNLERQHQLSIGSLVELDSGARMFVAELGRDCDGSPIYWLAAARDHSDRSKWYGGVGEESLELIRGAVTADHARP